ncbi:YqjF family protein [Lederbergia citrea]|uniref:YqjF family protein n=1 Tax=Lederbergia citrea TaxID=2833581 RepID=UPI001BC8D96B|nr:DUF2071 domain-containing protein [Lederbergia citrea]MBS4176485.1 DUF2071 domain-containing protein [Lederbergia citrea]MBS4203046.1 DUF2071 domain-containing protein [Lederbergia citrea]
MLHNEFLETDQRPFPLPSNPWLFTQTWDKLLFCHWSLPAELLRAHVPNDVDLDLFNGEAWIAIIPFKVNHMRVHGIPEIPYLNSYLELNLRTYVKYKGTPGIYFFTLDANKWSAVIGAKIGAQLPYRHSLMKMNIKENKVYFQSKRKHPGSSKESFYINYQSDSNLYLPEVESLEYWLFERYCFFTTRGKHLYRGDIHHDRWRVSKAKATIQANSLVPFLPQKYFERQPLLHLSASKQVFAWPIKKIQ